MKHVGISDMHVRSVLSQINRLEDYVNELEIVPATGLYRTRVILALVSKALTVGRAVCTLVEAGLPAEAFGLTRTLVDVYFCVRYLSNKDTEARAERYVEYSAKVQAAWSEVRSKYFPDRPMPDRPDREAISKKARKFKSKHQWTVESGQARSMAFEDDTFEVDERGKPLKAELDYDATYFETSHFVHVTVVALRGHGVEHGDVFRVRARASEEGAYGEKSLFNTLTSLSKIFISACRAMKVQQPEKILRDMQRLMRKYARGERSVTKRSRRRRKASKTNPENNGGVKM